VQWLKHIEKTGVFVTFCAQKVRKEKIYDLILENNKTHYLLFKLLRQGVVMVLHQL
jgi:hypothetical protein